MRQSCPTRPFSTILMPFQNIDRHDCFIVQQERHLGQDIMQAAALWNAHGPALFLRRGTIEMLESALQALLPAGTQALAEDALRLARRYKRLSGTPEIRFRLERSVTTVAAAFMLTMFHCAACAPTLAPAFSGNTLTATPSMKRQRAGSPC